MLSPSRDPLPVSQGRLRLEDPTLGLSLDDLAPALGDIHDRLPAQSREPGEAPIPNALGSELRDPHRRWFRADGLRALAGAAPGVLIHRVGRPTGCATAAPQVRPTLPMRPRRARYSRTPLGRVSRRGVKWTIQSVAFPLSGLPGSSADFGMRWQCPHVSACSAAMRSLRDGT